MSRGHKTRAIARPSGAASQHLSDDRTRADSTRLADFTRPIRADRQLVTGRNHRWVVALLATGILAALLAALFVLPVQAWLRQEDEIDGKQSELAVLTDANRKLSVEVDHLGTPEGAREAARDELGVVSPGEDRISMLPDASAGALALPAGWPYDTVAQIVAVRSAPPPATVEAVTGATIAP